MKGSMQFEYATAHAHDLVIDRLLAQQQAELSIQVMPQFWIALEAVCDELLNSDAVEEALGRCLQDLYLRFQSYQNQLREVLQQIGDTDGAIEWIDSVTWALSVRQQRMMEAQLTAVPATALGVEILLERCLKHRMASFVEHSTFRLPLGGDDDDEAPPSPEQLEVQVGLCDSNWPTQLHVIGRSLLGLGLEHVMRQAVQDTAEDLIDKRMVDHVSGNFGMEALQQVRGWVEAVPLQFAVEVLQSGSEGEASDLKRIFMAKAENSLSVQRCKDMFDIIKDFPDSGPALADLRRALRSPAMMLQLSSYLQSSISQRLLQSGAATVDILEQYVLTIRALRVVDSSGVVLEGICDPIRLYLRGRKDAVRCIVSMVTDDSGGREEGGDSLFNELIRHGDEPADVSDTEMDDDDTALATASSWLPDPPTADIRRSSRARRAGDVIAALSSIYGSKEAFVSEYKLMLADRLAAKTDFDCSRELATLELLKLRFGESNLNEIEVMLADVANSKRITSAVHAARVELSGVKATVVSDLFWPPLASDHIKLPDQVAAHLAAFGEEYTRLKTPRRLMWKSSLGSVLLTLTAGGTTEELRVSPAQAGLILLFSSHEQWQLTEVAAELETSVAATRKLLRFWTARGYLKESAGPRGIAIIERAEGAQSRSAAGHTAHDDDMPSAATLGQEARKTQEAEALSTYLLVMVSNFPAGKSLAEIHNMLKMFFKDPPYDKTIDDLASILSKLESQERVAFKNGMFSVQR